MNVSTQTSRVLSRGLTLAKFYLAEIWGDILADKSVCPDAKTWLGNHYDTHSLYGWSQSNQTFR